MPIYEGVTRGVLMSTGFASMGALMYVPPSYALVNVMLMWRPLGLVLTTGESRRRWHMAADTLADTRYSWWATAIGLTRFNEVFGTVETVNADGSITHSLSASEQSTGTAL